MFDPYHKWLGIAKDQRPPTHYQLLGISSQEKDAEVIEEAAIRQSSHVRTYQAGVYARPCIRLLNEIAQARATLLHPARRQEYDARLRENQEGDNQRLPAERRQPQSSVLAGQGPTRRVHLPSVSASQPINVELVPVPLADLPILPATLRTPTQINSRLGKVPLAILIVLGGGLVGYGLGQGNQKGSAPSVPSTDNLFAVPAGSGMGEVTAARVRGELRRLVDHAGPVHALAISPDGRWAASAGGGYLGRPGQRPALRDSIIRLWDLKTGEVLRRFEGHRAPVLSVAFSPNGRYLVSGSGGYEARTPGFGRVAVDCSVRLWDLEIGEETHSFAGHQAPVRGVAFSPDGRQVFSCSEDFTIRLWDVENGWEMRRMTHGLAPLRSLAVAPDGRHVLTGNTHGLMQLWDPENWSELGSFRAAEGEITSVAWSPDGRRALSAGGRLDAQDGRWQPIDCLFRLWNIDSGKEIRHFAGHTQPVQSVAFAADGRSVLSGSMDGSMRWWDIDTGRQLRCFEGHLGSVQGVAFSPDGRRALSGSCDRSLRWWDLSLAAD
jgi:WD40 repeat protein